MIGGAYLYRNLHDNHPSSPLTGTWFDQFPTEEIEVRSATSYKPPHFTLDFDAYRIWAMASQHRHRNGRGHFFPDYEVEEVADQLAAADSEQGEQYAPATVCLYSLAYHRGIALPTSQAMARISPTTEHLRLDLTPRRRSTPAPTLSTDTPVRELHALALNRPEPPIQKGDSYFMGPNSRRVSLAAMAVLHAVRLLPPQTILQHSYRLREGDESFPQLLAHAVGFGNSARPEQTWEGEFIIGRAVVGSAEREGSIIHTLHKYFDKHNIGVAELPPTL